MNYLDDYIKSVGIAYSKPAGDNWPANGRRLMSSYIRLVALKQLDLLNKAREKFPEKRVSELFWSTTQIRYILTGEFVVGLKLCQRDFKKPDLLEIINATEYLLNLLKLKTSEDPFCLNGKNNILNQKEVERIISSDGLTSSNRNDAKILAASLAAFSWAHGYDTHFPNFMDIQGPYFVENSKQLIVREFNFEEIKNVWENAPVLPQRVRIYLLYSNNDLTNDWELHLETKSEFNLIKAKILIVENGIERTPLTSEVLELIQKSSDATIKQVEDVNSMSVIEKVKKGAILSFLQTKSLADALGLDWKPEKEVEDAINTKAEDIWLGKNKTQKKSKSSPDDWLSTFDPRIPKD